MGILERCINFIYNLTPRLSHGAESYGNSYGQVIWVPHIMGKLYRRVIWVSHIAAYIGSIACMSFLYGDWTAPAM